MASLRRIRRKVCDGKRRYPDKDAARTGLNRLVHSPVFRGGFINCYPCKFCNGYHIGHKPKERSPRSYA